MSGGRVRIHAATVNPTDVGVRIGSLGLLSNFKRRTSRIFRIDNISVGMDPSLLNEGAIGRGDYRRTRLQRPSTGCSRSRGIRAHDRAESCGAYSGRCSAITPMTAS